MNDYVGDLVKRVRKFGFETVFRRYYSKYRGLVVSTNDPQKRNRILLQVPDLFGERDLANWAEPIVHAGEDVDQLETKTSGKYCGHFSPPKVGDWVFVEFASGDSSFPLYHPMGWIGDDERLAEFDEAEDWTMINPLFVSRFGHKIYVDETDGKARVVFETQYGQKFILDDTKDAQNILIQDKEGNKFKFDTKNKNCELDIKNNWVINVVNDANLKVGGNVNAEVTGNVAAKVQGNIDANVGGNVKADVTGNVSATCKKLDVKASGDVTAEGANVSVKSNGDASVEAAGAANIKAGGEATVKAPSVTCSATAMAEFKGTGGTNVGSGAAPTIVNGSNVLLGGGGAPVALMGGMAVGVGNLGAPVVCTIIQGSGKVFSA